MAGNDGTLNFNTKIDSSGFQKGLDGIGSVAKKGLAVTSKVLGVAATAVTALGGAAIKAGSDFETSFTKASTLFGDVAVNTDNLNTKILEMSSVSGTAATELNETLYQAMSAGIPVTENMEDALKAVDTANKLSIGGYTSASTAMGALTTAINAYKLPASDAVKISDQLVTVQNKGVTTVDELASNMGKAIATGSAYGINLENINAGYIALTKSGISTAESTTYMSSMFNELGKSSSTVGEIIRQKTGLSFAELIASGGSLADAMDVLAESVDGDSSALINLFGSAEAGKAANAIMQQGTDSFRQSLDDLAKSAGSTQSAYEAMVDTFGGQLGILQQSATNLLTSMYETMQDTAKDVVKEAQGMVQQLQDAFNEGGFQGLVGALGNVLAQIVQRIAEAAPTVIEAAVSLVMSFCDGLKSAPGIGESGASLITSLVTGLMSCVGEIWTTSIVLIGKLAEGIAAGAPQMVQAISTTVTDIMECLVEWGPDLLQAGVDILLALVDGIADALPTLAYQAAVIIEEMAMALVDNIPALMDAALQLVEGLVQGIVDAMPVLLEGSIQAFMAILEALPVVIEQLLQALPDLITAIIDFLVENTSMIVDGSVQMLMGIIEAIPAIAVAIVENLPAIINAIVMGLAGAVPRVREASEALLTSIATTLKDIPPKIGQILTEAIGRIIQWGADIQMEAQEAASGFVNNILTFLSGLPENIAHWLGYAIGVVIKWGADLAAWVMGEIPLIINSIVTFFSELPGKIWEWLVNVITRMVAWKQQMLSTAKTAISNVISSIISQLAQLPGKVTGELAKVTAGMVQWGADIVSRMTEVGKNIVSGIWNGISSGWDWLKGKVADLANSLLDGAKEALGINSPSTEFRDEFGRWLMPGAVEGVKMSMPKSLREMKAEAGKLVAAMRGTVDMAMNSFTLATANGAGLKAGAAGATFVQIDNSQKQENNYHEKVISPSEVAKNQREAFRNFQKGVK